jgi:predicted outer membrane repeat protein
MNDSSSVSGNTASVDGGGIYNGSRSPGNGCLLSPAGSSSVTGSTAVEYGGGIYNDASQGATITFEPGWDGTISGNVFDNIFNA